MPEPEIVTPIEHETCRHCGDRHVDAFADHPPVFGPVQALGGEVLAFACLREVTRRA